MPMLWIQSRVDYINNLPQILSKTAQQQQAQPSLQHSSKGLDSSKLEHHLVQQNELAIWAAFHCQFKYENYMSTHLYL